MIKRFTASIVCLAFIFNNFQYVYSQGLDMPMPGLVQGGIKSRSEVNHAADDLNFRNILAQSNSALISWMHYNVYPESGIPRSFEIPKDPREAKEFWGKIGDDAGGIPGFGKDEFSDILPASGLIQAINRSGISVPKGNDDVDNNDNNYDDYNTDRLNNLLKTKDLRNKLLNLKLPLQVSNLIRGIVPKRMFMRVDWNGSKIIDRLIKKGVLKEVSPRQVQLKENKGKPIIRPQEIAGSNWDEIWTILQLSLKRETEPTENTLMRSNRVLLEEVYPRQCPLNGLTGIVERVIINDGLSIYEGAVWQAALVMAGGQYNFKAVDDYTDMLNFGSFDHLRDIRAWDKPYTYQGKKLSKKEAYFFRMISPRYLQRDPLTGYDVKPGFPEFDRIHWVDWMPILGENAWVIIGLLQTAYAKGHGKADPNSKEVKLAESIIPAIKALRTKIGAVLYTAKGVYDKDTSTISTENNTSLHSAMMMLYAATNDPQYLEIARGIESFFKKYCYDKENHRIYQGGIYANGKFLPAKPHFALDSQTWGILEFSPEKIDGWYGEGEAYRMWKGAKKYVGFYEDCEIRGVGFTNGHDIHSAEWTWGAIGATNELALYYQKSHPDWARECLADSISMLKGQEDLKHIDKDGHKSYLYSNKRFYIPWGWWANPVPNLASTAWAYLIQNGYDPFRLGEKTCWFTLPGFQAAVEKYQGAGGNGTVNKKAKNGLDARAVQIKVRAAAAPMAWGKVPIDFGDYRSETLVTKAWEALAQNDLESVLAYTNKCISLYAEQASKMQAGLIDYASGDNDDIFQYWALNDVAISYFIQGEAYRAVNMKDKAKEAYKKIIKNYSFGQCWDSKGWFWKPAEAAKERLNMMAHGANWDFGDYTSSTLVIRAWAALAANDLKAVLAYTNKCISIYGKQAHYMQSSLKRYPSGSNAKIFQYWALNDVATSYFIQGEGFRAANMKDKAKEAYNKVIREYSFGQSWDPGISEFSADEFKKLMTPDALIKAIETRGVIDVPVAGTPIQSLNKLLENKDLYRVMTTQPDEVRDFISRLEQGKRLNFSETEWLNRTLIEANYPLETPVREGWFWKPADAAQQKLDEL